MVEPGYRWSSRGIDGRAGVSLVEPGYRWSSRGIDGRARVSMVELVETSVPRPGIAGRACRDLSAPAGYRWSSLSRPLCHGRVSLVELVETFVPRRRYRWSSLSRPPGRSMPAIPVDSPGPLPQRLGRLTGRMSPGRRCRHGMGLHPRMQGRNVLRRQYSRSRAAPPATPGRVGRGVHPASTASSPGVGGGVPERRRCVRDGEEVAELESREASGGHRRSLGGPARSVEEPFEARRVNAPKTRMSERRGLDKLDLRFPVSGLDRLDHRFPGLASTSDPQFGLRP